MFFVFFFLRLNLYHGQKPLLELPCRCLKLNSYINLTFYYSVRIYTLILLEFDKIETITDSVNDKLHICIFMINGLLINEEYSDLYVIFQMRS